MKPILIFLFLALGFSVKSQFSQINIFKDSLHFPFTYGVTSGDPTTDKMIIWTRIESNVDEVVTWQMSQDSLFSVIEQTGTFPTNAARDWTVKVDVSGLQPETIYYYRFISAANEISDYGIGKTAPVTDYDHSRIAIMSCSSVFSGYFNAYQRIAERKDLDLIIHVGDYIYDFVDTDEEVRIPDPFPIDPTTLTEWRDRHKYYLMDPNLRAARKAHSWMVMWDNHDIDAQPGYEMAPFQAFLEYIPVRLPNPVDSLHIYRKYSYGNLMDIFLTDVRSLRNQDTLADGSLSMLGITQYNWLTSSLANSTAKWKLIPMQTLMAGWSVQNIPAFIGIGHNGVLDPGNWDGFDYERDKLLNFIDSSGIDNVIVLSGDEHVSIVADLSTDPQNAAVYNPQNGQGSVGVEFLPTSISRGNFDEMGYGWAIGIVTPIMEAENPNHVFMNLVDHGYGLVDIKKDSCVAELWYSDILHITNVENFQKGFVVKNGENHWRRNFLTTPTPPKTDNTLALQSIENTAFRIYPNPTKDKITFCLDKPTTINAIKVISELGNEVKTSPVLSMNKTCYEMRIDLLPGNYFLQLDTNRGNFTRKFIVR